MAVELVREAGVGLIRLIRPEKMNALDLAMRQALAAAFVELTEDSAVRAIVVAGSDKVFAAGADLALLADKGPAEVHALGFADLWRPIADCPKPVIAAVAGLALGAGCELALMCDIIVADPTARFGQPESRVGIMPGAGGGQRLMRLFGKHLTSYLLLGGGTLDAARAYALGMVCELAEVGAAETAAMAIAARLAKQPPLALAAIKRALAVGAELPLAAANLVENREFLLLFASADQKEGMAAFLEKRNPVFEGR